MSPQRSATAFSCRGIHPFAINRKAANALKMRLQSAGLGQGNIQMEGGFTDQTNLANLARRRAQ